MTDPQSEFDGAAAVDPASYKGAVTDVGFSSPSGNITCGIQSGTVVCQIDRFDYKPPKKDCGPSGWGFNFRLTESGSAALFCAGDVESGGPALDYGHQLTVGHVRCVSQKDGVTCQNTGSGNGFRLARAAYTFFGPNEISTVGTAGTTAVEPAPDATMPSAMVGQWGQHGATLTIDKNGESTLNYRTYRWCSDDPTPPCDSMKGNTIVDGGHIAMQLEMGAKSIVGEVTTSSDPTYPVGTPVTITAKGYHLSLSIWPADAPFCAANTPAGKWDCGA